MSSSKIIKSVQPECSDISSFNFRQIDQSMTLPAADPLSTGFVPMGLTRDDGAFTSWNESSRETSEVAGSPLVEITEEDLDRKISDAFNAGLEDGKNLAERGLLNVFKTLRSSSEIIHNLRDKIFRESEDEIINLIMLVARKVIMREISQDRSILAGIVQNALVGLSAREEITVRISPDDYQLVTAGRDDLLHKELLTERLLLTPDPSVAVGFCLVDTEMGTVDASLEGQMDQIYRSLLEQRTATAVKAA